MTFFDASEYVAVSTVLSFPATNSVPIVVRDSIGQISVVLPQEMAFEKVTKLEQLLASALGHYARPEGLLRTNGDFGVEALVARAAETHARQFEKGEYKFIDNRVVGQQWLGPLASRAEGPPRIVFASMKGGVGRSTALCVAAAYLSLKGVRVLAVDLDFEAPGLGSMLLGPGEIPTFGTLDWMVENGLGNVDQAFITKAIGDSYLGSNGARVSVMPALGKATLENPSNALSKIARAYLDDVDSDGVSKSLGAQIDEMIVAASETGDYDVVLIDARAGLHETTGAALLSLGSDIFLFGTDQPQTFEGFRLMLAHISANFDVDTRLSISERLEFVHSKASEVAKDRADAFERFSSLHELLGGTEENLDGVANLDGDDFELDWSDEEVEIPEGEVTVHVVLDDPRYRDFDPIARPHLLTSSVFESAYGSLLARITDIVEQPDTYSNDD